MVAVGDDELLVGHGGEEEIDEVGVGELPDVGGRRRIRR